MSPFQVWMMRQKKSIELVQKIFNEWKIPIIFVTHSNYEAEKMAHEIINIGK